MWTEQIKCFSRPYATLMSLLLWIPNNLWQPNKHNYQMLDCYFKMSPNTIRDIPKSCFSHNLKSHYIYFVFFKKICVLDPTHTQANPLVTFVYREKCVFPDRLASVCWSGYCCKLQRRIWCCTKEKPPCNCFVC